MAFAYQTAQLLIPKPNLSESSVRLGKLPTALRQVPFLELFSQFRIALRLFQETIDHIQGN